MRKILIVFLFLFNLSYSKDLVHIKDIIYFTENILRYINSNRYSEALLSVEQNSINRDVVFKFRRYLTYIKKKKKIGYFFLHEEDIKNTLYKISYIQKNNSSVQMIVFFFYKPSDRWFLYDFYVENDIKSIFQER